MQTRTHSTLLGAFAAAAMLLIAAFLFGACSSAAGAFLPGNPAVRGPMVTIPPDATATATPFLPIPATATPLPPPAATATPAASPTPVEPWGNFAAPSEPSAIDVPRPMDPIDVPPGTVNILLMGSDQRPNDYGHRTDTLMVLSLDPANGKARMLSIPRDLYVYIPGYRVNRINTADAIGGAERVAETILYNFGLNIHHWVRINFSGFTSAIDALGGIDVQVGGYLNDECGGRRWRYAPGTYHMDGFSALCYVRMRKTSSDYDRLRRQQEVLLAAFNRILSLDGLARFPDFYNQFQALVETDMQIGDLLPLIPLAAQLSTDTASIQRLAIDRSLGTPWRVPYSGASVILPDREAIESMLRTAFES